MRKSLAPSLFSRNKNKRDVNEIISIINTCNEVKREPEKQDLAQENGNAFSVQEKENFKNDLEIIKRFAVVWGKPSTKKHKTWERDGFLELTPNKSILLRSEDGNILASKNLNTPTMVEVGQILKIGSKEVEVIEELSNISLNVSKKRPIEDDLANTPQDIPRKKTKIKSFQSPLIGATTQAGFLTNAPQVILPQPSCSHQWKCNTSMKNICQVKIDKFLSNSLRPHQKEGIAFLYSCIMGFTSDEMTGAILADEMGLGKTLQCIALIWTLLKQGPYGTPVIKRALIITPSTLCGTWEKEFLRWLGSERLIPFLINNNNKPDDFKARPCLPVMIISYERFAKYFEDIQGINFDLVICDEAHRLKNANIKSAQAIQNLVCKRRILLTGTPIQNDLQEYFVLIDIVNPGIFGTYNDFKEKFVNPILNSQKPGCSEMESKTGEQSAELLQHLTSRFILRRTQILLKDFLPTKTEYVVCCKVTALQRKLYTLAVNHWWNKRELGLAPLPLTMIVLLKKICNSLSLISSGVTSTSDNCDLLRMLPTMLPANVPTLEDSNKLVVLEALVKNIIKMKEKLVIVSYSTKMLDILMKLCNRMSVSFSRLDGSTPVASRQTIVESFNSPYGASVLLLSSRAGGAGLSLPSASHLVLYDSDWNPAIDNQAMARIWRDGQKKPVSIYRFLVTGSIEEKIYQRQMFKTGISDAVADPDNIKTTLKLCDEELKELFVNDFNTASSTHDMLNCTCLGDGTPEELNEVLSDKEDIFDKPETINSKTASINQLKNWQHFKVDVSDTILNELGLIDFKSEISIIFRKKNTT